ncbi:MAG TPA: TerC/Alx family metal homeostasis membrane protein [Pseudonocardiaceae bacterium]|jgi:tellurite resistance protein TerC|nr:TerC/Alx family metal homeostasis membrane protein [Pseudonocardiaceae bacterium]
MTVAWWVWLVTLGAFAALIAVDLHRTRSTEHVTFRLAVFWSAGYLALALLFGAGVFLFAGSTPAVEYLTGFAVEKTLSVDNIFVFAVVLAGFAVPGRHQARILSVGIVGALLMRAVLIIVGISAVERFSFLFLVFGLFLCVAAVRLVRSHGSVPDGSNGRVVRWARRVLPVVDDDTGKLVVRRDRRWALTALALPVIAILSVDALFALDSIPAILGITQSTYLVLCANVFALLGLRPLYFLLVGLRDRLVHLQYGLAVVLGFIGVKLAMHYLHTVWSWVPEISAPVSLIVVVAVFAVTTVTSLRAVKRTRERQTLSPQRR